MNTHKEVIFSFDDTIYFDRQLYIKYNYYN